MNENQHLKAINNALHSMVPLRMEAYDEIKNAAAALVDMNEELEKKLKNQDIMVNILIAVCGEQAVSLACIEKELKVFAHVANSTKEKLTSYIKRSKMACKGCFHVDENDELLRSNCQLKTKLAETEKQLKEQSRNVCALAQLKEDERK